MKINYASRAMSTPTETRELKDKLSRCQKSIIKDAITALPHEERCNRNSVVAKVCELLEERYQTEESGNNMENQMVRMGIKTVKDVAKKTDAYYMSHVNLVNR